MELLKTADPRYPKAKYRKALEGEGDVKSPAYERIVMQGGDAKRIVDFHLYVSTMVNTPAEEAALGDGWCDSPADIDKPKVKAKAAQIPDAK